MEAEQTTTFKPPKCICPKHGEVRDDYVFRVHMPEFGYEKMSFCLVCAVEYLAMVAQEITYEYDKEDTTDKEEKQE